jgi:Zn-dependent metalloprotease
MRKKKTGFSSKIFKTITIVFVVCCFMATSSWAAKKVEFVSSNAKKYIKELNKSGDLSSAAIGQILGLGQDEELMLLRKIKDSKKVTHYRYQQTLQGIPVWGMHTNVGISPSNKVIRLHGSLVLESGLDVKHIPSSLDPQGALRSAQEEHRKNDKNATWNFSGEKYGTYIYFHKNNKAYLVYAVSFFADNEKGNPSRPLHIIDAKTGKILLSYDNLQEADGTGPGGNEKIGQYEYGTDFPPFGVTQNGSTCTMDTTDVKTVNLNHGTSGSTPWSYTCPRNTVKFINGAYSPLNDAQFFGQVVFDMFMDWYGVPPLTFQLTMRVHYSTNYENAFWNGSSMTFGDGYTTFYPLVSLDVSAHEVSHGFTEQNSNLIYSGESGGINEAYSDMAGEASEYYSRGSNDFLVGYDIFKNPTGALRYMHDPPLDGISIDHVDDYYSGMDVHYSSGVFNKAFWLIATTSGWNTRMAFDIFTRANQVYWTPSTTFQQGAEGARDAAVDLGYSCVDVRNAFAVVGIPLDCPGLPAASFTYTTSHLNRTVNFTDTSTCPSCTITAWDWDFGDGNTSTEQNPTHTYAADGTYTVTLTVTDDTSDTDSTQQDVTVPGPPPSVGNTEIFGSRSVSANRRAMPFTMPETGTISSVTMYHDAGTGSMILGVYDGEGMPANRIGVTPTTPLTAGAGWQTIDLINPVVVQGGTTVWLAWVYEVNPGIAYKTGTPGRVDAGVGWAGGMPDPYGSGTQADFLYSIFAYYEPGGTGNQPPTADFIYVTNDLTVDFTDTSTDSDGTIVSWDWNFGDGNTSTAQNPSHTYAAAGTYSVTLTVTDNDGATDSISKDVTVTAPNVPPTADFTFTTDGLTANFTDTSTDSDGTIVAWDWNFGDGNTSTVQNPSHTYASGGTYSVTLTVTDNDGATDSVTKDVTVTETVIEIYVNDITQTITKKGKNYESTAVVTIWDTNSAPVANATVSITWSGVVSGSASGVTDANGTVSFKSGKVKSTGPFTITVDNVTHGTYNYNPALNVETSDTATF